MRLSTLSSLLAATLLAASGVFASADQESTGALTIRDVFEDGDLFQERDFNEIDEIDARDYFEDDLEARSYTDEDIVKARNLLNMINELEARGYSTEDLEARKFRLKGLFRTLGRIGKGVLRTVGRVAASQFGLGRRDFEDDEELLARVILASRARGDPLTGGDHVGGGRLRDLVSVPERGGHGIGHRRGGRRNGLTRGHRTHSTEGRRVKGAVEAREFWDYELEEREADTTKAQARRRSKNQRKSLRNKFRNQRGAAGAGTDPGAPVAHPAAVVQERDLEIDQLD